MSGVPITVNAMPAVTPTGGDSVPVWDTESGIQGRVTLNNLGAIFALLTGATFVGALMVSAGDSGAGAAPPVRVYNNTNAITPAPGAINLVRADGQNASVYTTNDGLLRIANVFNITNANMAGGTVVGSQSSNLAEKDVLAGLSPIEDVLAAVAAGAAAVRRFVYKAPLNGDTGEREGERPYGGEVFEGVIIDYAERYGMDRDEAHPEGRSLNTINATGDLLRAVAWLVEENAALTARVAALEGA